MTILTNPKWIQAHHIQWARFQQQRRLRLFMLKIEQQSWPQHLIDRIINEFLPLIEEENADAAQIKYKELELERINCKFGAR